MLPKAELIKTKEFWIETLSNTIWGASGAVEENSDKCDVIAESIVTDDFMNQVNALNQPEAAAVSVPSPAVKCPECLTDTPQEELDTFGGWCEECRLSQGED